MEAFKVDTKNIVAVASDIGVASPAIYDTTPTAFISAGISAE